MKRALCLAAALIPIAQPAMAACRTGEVEVFACTTERGKEVLVCDAGETLSYAFGRKGAPPELALRVPRPAASTFQWRGMGRWMSYAVTVPNEGTAYTVHWAVDRLGVDHPVEAGIRVERDRKTLSSIECRQGTVRQQMEGIDLRASD